VLDHQTAGETVLHHSMLGRWLDGTQPHMRLLRLDHVIDVDDAIPCGFDLERRMDGVGLSAVVASAPDTTVLCIAKRSSTTVRATAATAEALSRLVDHLIARFPEEPPKNDEVPFDMWWSSGPGQSRHRRMLLAPAWQEVAGNYPATTRTHLERLMSAVGPSASGKLILWHGAPGTGKTTAIRALARAWQPWCSADLIADPERFFSDVAYMTAVMASTTSGYEADSWRLIIAEDADEYLRATARHDAGAALGRLLNLTDGLLGQGQNVLVLLTTNEDLGRLHPALTRPGRCLARIEFPRFNPQEAAQWLGEGSNRLFALKWGA